MITRQFWGVTLIGYPFHVHAMRFVIWGSLLSGILQIANWAIP